MNKNEALIELCQALARDRGVLAQLNWQKVVLRCEADERSMSMGGFSFDLQGDVLPIAPHDVQVDVAFEKLRKIMQLEERQEKAMILVSYEGGSLWVQRATADVFVRWLMDFSKKHVDGDHLKKWLVHAESGFFGDALGM